MKKILMFLATLSLLVSTAKADTTVIPPETDPPIHFRGYVCELTSAYAGGSLKEGGCWENGLLPYGYGKQEEIHIYFQAELDPIVTKKVRASDGFYNFRYENGGNPIPARWNFGIELERPNNTRVYRVFTEGRVWKEGWWVGYNWYQWCCVRPPTYPWLDIEPKSVSWTNWIIEIIPTPTLTPTTFPTYTPTPTPLPTQYFPLIHK